MKLTLFVSASFGSCRIAESVWRQVAGEQGGDLAVVDVSEPAGATFAEQWGVTVVPALAVDGRVIAVGVQTGPEARRLLARFAPGTVRDGGDATAADH